MVKQVKIVRVYGYNPGEVVNMDDNRALTYVLNGQVEPVGWKPDKQQNRMMSADDEHVETATPRRRRPAARTTPKEDE